VLSAVGHLHHHFVARYDLITLYFINIIHVIQQAGQLFLFTIDYFLKHFTKFKSKLCKLGWQFKQAINYSYLPRSLHFVSTASMSAASYMAGQLRRKFRPDSEKQSKSE